MPDEVVQAVRGDSPVLIHVPHAGLHFPAAAATALRDDLDLGTEVRRIADLHMDRLLAMICESLDEAGIVPTTVVSPNSRLFMDPERFPDEREEMNAVGMGVVYQNGVDGRPLYGSPLSEAVREARIREYYEPYTRALVRESAAALGRFGRLLFVDLHSYASTALPFEIHKDEARPPLCIGLDHSIHDPDADVLAALGARFDSAVDQPYHGTYVPAPWYRRDPRLRSVMLELRKDQYMDEHSFALADDAVAVARRIAEWIVLASRHAG